MCIQGFVNEYPDVKIDQLVTVLLTRGDVGRGEARQVCPVLPVFIQLLILIACFITVLIIHYLYFVLYDSVNKDS